MVLIYLSLFFFCFLAIIFATQNDCDYNRGSLSMLVFAIYNLFAFFFMNIILSVALFLLLMLLLVPLVLKEESNESRCGEGNKRKRIPSFFISFSLDVCARVFVCE